MASSAGSASGSQIIQLENNNYPTWRLQCQMALMKDGLWSIVNGTEKKPDKQEEVTKFNKNCDKALAVIVLSISPSLLYIIGEPSNPVEVWQKLADNFVKKTWANKLHLRKKLYSLKLEEGGSVQNHIKTMLETFSALSVVGDTVTEEDKVVHILASLPESYNMLVVAFEACQDVPKLDTVIERLLHEERKSENVDLQKGLAATSKRNAGRGNSRGVRCYGCNAYGHIHRHCPETKMKGYRAHNARNEDHSPEVSLNAVLSTSDTTVTGKDTSWIIDSGATCHMCNDKDMFIEFRELHTVQLVKLGDGKSVKATGRGNIKLEVIVQGELKMCVLNDVLCVPDLAYNLLSIPKASSKIEKSVFFNDRCVFVNEDKIIAEGFKEGELYYLKLKGCDSVAISKVHVESQNYCIHEWHKKLAHRDINDIKRMKLKIKACECTDICEDCVKGKMSTKPFHTSTSNISEIFDLVVSDVCGPFQVESVGRSKYFVTFIDVFSRYSKVFFLRKKSDVCEKLIEFVENVKTQFHKTPKVFRSDRGGEYLNDNVQKYLKNNGIDFQCTVGYAPQQNGIAERKNRTLVEAARSMLSDAGLAKCWWAEAVNTANYIQNRVVSSVIECSPFEKLYGKCPELNDVHRFGESVFAKIPDAKRQKLDDKAVKLIFLGHDIMTNGYRLGDVSTKKVVISRDVKFLNEHAVTDVKVNVEPSREEDSEVEPKQGDASENEDEAQSNNEQVAVQEDIALRRSEREKVAPNRYGEWVYITCENSEPRSFKEAMKSIKNDKWQDAMKREMNSLHENDVWELVSLPSERKCVGSKWVFKEKLGPDGKTERYKARLVAQGYSQQQGLDYDETFSPVVRPESVRLMIALASAKNMILHQMDVETAFLNGCLEEDIYMRQPEGFEKAGSENLVCRLKKSIYGLKQSPRCWNVTLDSYLQEIGFKQSKYDPCIYTSEGVILAVYVDDIILASESDEQMKNVKKLISSKFTVKDMGRLAYFLGVSVDQESKSHVWVGQPAYTQKVLERFNMDASNSVATPADNSTKLIKNDGSMECVDQKLYQSAVGSLLYLSMWSRPDITYAVHHVAKFSSQPTKEHWTAVKRIMRYLQGTINYGLCYTKGGSVDGEIGNILGYSDADWAGDVNDRKSTSGYLFQVCNGTVSWRSKKQTCVALSTAEAEYMALSSAAQEAVWLRNLSADLKNDKIMPVVIYEDNQAAICITKNPQFHGRAKHFDIKFHFIREQVEKGQVVLKYCPSKKMLADILTKGLDKEQFITLRSMMGVQQR